MTLLERFISKVRMPEDPAACWEWKGGVSRYGYGIFKVGGERWAAHRVSHHLFIGPIPTDLQVCHSCDNRGCCNPDHLHLGTAAENIRERDERGRSAKGPHNGGWKDGRCTDMRKYRTEQSRRLRAAKKAGVE